MHIPAFESFHPSFRFHLLDLPSVSWMPSCLYFRWHPCNVTKGRTYLPFFLWPHFYFVFHNLFFFILFLFDSKSQAFFLEILLFNIDLE
jgi:hypothetical protein